MVSWDEYCETPVLSVILKVTVVPAARLTVQVVEVPERASLMVSSAGAEV